MESKKAVKPKSEDVKANDPKAKKAFSRREALKAGLLALGGLALSRCSSEYKPNGGDGGQDGSTADASGLDAHVTQDASLMDGSVHDGGMDANLPDAMAHDASPPVCVSSEDSLLWQQMHPGDIISVGGYNVNYVSMVDLQNITVDVTCAADSSSVASGVNLHRAQDETLPLPGGMNLKLTFISGNENFVFVSATVAPTI